MTEIIIKPQKFKLINLRELREFRDTLFFLAWRDIKVKYKQALLGFLWVILQPLLMTLIFVIFSKATKLSLGPSDVPYPIFVLSGMLLWNLFSSSINLTAQSVISNAYMIKKIYFPRIFFPLSALIVNSFDFIISFIIILPIMLYYQIFPGFKIIYLFPVVYFLISLLVLGVGSFFAALNVRYRDVKYIIPFLLQMLFFISPVFYTNKIIEVDCIRNFYYANPMTGIIELFRHAMFDTHLYLEGLLMSTSICIFMFLIGVLYFGKVQHTFADIA